MFNTQSTGSHLKVMRDRQRVKKTDRQRQTGRVRETESQADLYGVMQET